MAGLFFCLHPVTADFVAPHVPQCARYDWSVDYLRRLNCQVLGTSAPFIILVLFSGVTLVYILCGLRGCNWGLNPFVYVIITRTHQVVKQDWVFIHSSHYHEMLRLRTVRTTHIMPTKAILGPAHIQGYVGDRSWSNRHNRSKNRILLWTMKDKIFGGLWALVEHKGWHNR